MTQTKTDEEKVRICKMFLEKRGWIVYQPTVVPGETLNKYPPIAVVTRTRLTTDEAAFYLNRQPQTLRKWAAFENGPIRPIRVNGRLAWLTSDVKSLLT